jgi:hypothetical protein
MTAFSTPIRSINPRAATSDMRRMALELAAASRHAHSFSVDELLAEAQKVVDFIETGTVMLTRDTRLEPFGYDIGNHFRGNICVVDDKHMELTLVSETEDNVRAIVQPEQWDTSLYLSFLERRSIVFAKGMRAFGLPLIMRASVELVDEIGGAE